MVGDCGGTFASIAPWGPIGQTIMGGLFVGMILVLKNAYQSKKSREPSRDFSSYIEAAPTALKNMVRDISHNLGLKKVPGVYAIKSPGNSFINGFATPSYAFIADKLYKKMNNGERKFTAAHEVAHVSKENWKGFDAMETADIISLAFAPGLLITAFAGVANSAAMPLAAFGPPSAAIAIGGAYIFNRFMNYFYSSISEFRADRLAVAATADPMSAISFLTNYEGDEEFTPHFFPDDTYHPAKRTRILRIVEDFNKANPEQAIAVYGRTWFYPERNSLKEATVLYFDATHFDGQCYKINPLGFYPVKPMELPGNPPEIGAGQPLPNPV